MCYCCYVSASDTWFLLGYSFRYLVFVSGFGLWTFNGSRVSDHRLWMGISVSSWVLIDINFGSWALIALVLRLWICFSFCPLAFDRFQLPVVFGIQGSEPSKVY
ncbi:unnamed protein product [Rhizophagus irregularis]|nr:unnamed protein product [Rhizophagus irregularis]